MKPLGQYLSITGIDTLPESIDNDYDWHLRNARTRRAEAGSAVPRRRRRSAAKSAAQRIAALVRLPRSRSRATTAPQA
jgi:hypothetical protein